MPTEPAPDALDAFVDALIQSYGQLALVVEHMIQSTAPEAERGSVVLHRLLRDTLEPLAQRRGDTDVAVAAELVSAATDVIGDEIYLVRLDE